MNLWHDVAPHRVRPEDFLAVIEIEKGSKNKYEMDKETGALRCQGRTEHCFLGPQGRPVSLKKACPAYHQKILEHLT